MPPDALAKGAGISSDDSLLGARAQIAPAATGRPLRLYVLVELRDESRATLNELVRRYQSLAVLNQLI